MTRGHQSTDTDAWPFPARLRAAHGIDCRVVRIETFAPVAAAPDGSAQDCEEWCGRSLSFIAPLTITTMTACYHADL